MRSFDAMRRELLRASGIGAAAGVPAFSLAAAAQQEGVSASSGVFDVRKFKAAGDGKALDTQAVDRSCD